MDSFSWIVIIGALAFVAFAVMRKRRAETAAVRSPPPWIRLSVLIGLIAATGVVFANLDLAPKLSHMDLVVFSGPQAGHNHVLVDRLADNALRRNGTIENIATQGAAENLELLAKSSDRSRFALVQDSIPFPDKENLELVARLPSPETVFFIGPDANNIRRFADLSGLRIGIGPAGSGSALLARELLGAHGFEALNVTLSRHDFSEQAALLHDGGLDLGVFVISAESELIADAVRGGLQIASFEYLDALPHYIPAARVEWLPAGYYDYLEVLPKSDKKVLRVDTLVLGDRRAPRSDVVSLLALLDQTLHGFIQYNRNTPNNSGLPMAKDLRLFIENDGPSLLDEYAPVLVNFIPPANIVHLIMAISILFNVMGGWNRYRLWRVDSARVEIENLSASIFGARLTVDELAELKPVRRTFPRERVRRLEKLIADYETLARRCRRYSLSILVPMGRENVYRSHEQLINLRLSALRGLRRRIGDGDGRR